MSGTGSLQDWRPVDAGRLADLLAAWIDEASGSPRVAIDGPPCADAGAVAASMIEPLRALGRPVVHLEARTFWRDASLRLEHGHHDVISYPDWLDRPALRRETLDPFAAGAAFLTSLRDPTTNRSTRAAPQPFVAGTVLLVSGTFLLIGDLPFERTVHLHLPSQARGRRTPPDEAWTLPAFDAYDVSARPVENADVTVRLDRRSPAVRGLR